MADPLLTQIFFAAVVLATLFAFLKGEEPERIGAGALAMAVFSALLLRDETRLDQPQAALMAIDAALLLMFGALAWKSRRVWPAWAAAAQAVAVMAQALAFLDLHPAAASANAAAAAANLAALVILCVGVAQAWRDRRADAREAG